MLKINNTANVNNTANIANSTNATNSTNTANSNNIATNAAKTIYIKTFGCSLNYSDSEVMAGLLKEAGYNIITNYGIPDHLWIKNPDSKKKYDLVIINTCSVKNLAENKFLKELRNWKIKGIRVIAAGCVPQADPEILNTTLKNIPVIGTRQLMHTVDIVNDAFNNKIIQNITNEYNERLNLPKIRKSGIIEILPISEGCLSNCSYCKTKFARGELLSYPKDKIIMQFKSALSEGCKEFWITSQDNGCYGFDIYRKEKYFLPQLLNDLLSIDGDFKIRLGMANPDHIKRIRKELITVFKHPKMFKFLHIPIQSGSNKVLRTMKRFYTVQEYIDIVNDFKDNISDITISTDIIIGFPEESDKEFMETINLIQITMPDVVNISKFWARTGTSAARMKQLYSGVIKQRSEHVKKVFLDVLHNNNASWIGRECEVLIDEFGKNDSIIARNDSYKQIILNIKASHNMFNIGDYALVKIVSQGIYDLKAELIRKL